MDTIFYGTIGVAALFASAFLFAFYEDIRSKWEFKVRKAKRLIKQMDRSEEHEHNAILRVSDYNE